VTPERKQYRLILSNSQEHSGLYSRGNSFRLSSAGQTSEQHSIEGDDLDKSAELQMFQLYEQEQVFPSLKFMRATLLNRMREKREKNM
jgi:hypothetical protein